MPRAQESEERRAELLDDEGDLTQKFEDCLAYIFSKYCVLPGAKASESERAPSSDDKTEAAASSSEQAAASTSAKPAIALGERPPAGAVLTDVALDRFAYETNGAPLPQESKDEIVEFLDTDEQGRLTFGGFIQMYSLQTENDEEETWRDLATHGFDNHLRLVSTRREDAGVDEGSPLPKIRIQGHGMGGPNVQRVGTPALEASGGGKGEHGEEEQESETKPVEKAT